MKKLIESVSAIAIIGAVGPLHAADQPQPSADESNAADTSTDTLSEVIVTDPAVEIRRLLDFCGLPFEPACLSFHATQRPIRTVSSEQVRHPLYRDALDRWRHYEPWLGPLKSALGPALEMWRTADV